MSRTKPSDQIKALIASFAGIRDIRIERRKLYPLNEILFLSLSAVISGYSEWDEIVDLGKRNWNGYGNIYPMKTEFHRTTQLIGFWV